MQSDTLDLDFSYQAERYLLTARAGRTEARGGTSLTANFGQRIGDPADAYGTFDARGGSSRAPPGQSRLDRG